jgi:hypothetical protein
MSIIEYNDGPRALNRIFSESGRITMETTYVNDLSMEQEYSYKDI